jgi:hypothetical protein
MDVGLTGKRALVTGASKASFVVAPEMDESGNPAASVSAQRRKDHSNALR